MDGASNREVVVASTGTANVASVCAALRRARCEPLVTEDAARVRSATHVVLPGVGTFAAAMERLHAAGLGSAIVDRVRTNRSTLAICLGMQVLFESSDESPGVDGLGLLRGRAERFGAGAGRVPLMGWACVGLRTGFIAPVEDAGAMYFANSFRVRSAPEDWRAAWADHGGPFLAAIERGRIVACQFHPELSGRAGEQLLARWIGAAPDNPDPRVLDSALVAVPAKHGGTAQCPPVTGRERRRGATRRVIACLDVRGRRVVKGVRFQCLRDAGDPAELARAYQDQGADEIVLLDVSATAESRATGAAVVARVRDAVGIAVAAGGGVRSVHDVGRVLSAGADKVVLNSAAVERADLVRECADRFGAQCVVVAIDAARRDPAAGPATSAWEVVVRSGTVRTGLCAVEWADQARAAGAGELLVTSWDRDGTGLGYDLELVRAIAQRVRVPVVASGGARTPSDMADALHAGADAVLGAGMFHSGAYAVSDVKTELARAGLEVRR